MNPLTFTPDAPCRCGYDGTGIHQCHAGRHPLYPGGRCTREGIPFLTAYLTSLAGVQTKYGVAVGVYCDEHRVEAGFAPRRDAP